MSRIKYGKKILLILAFALIPVSLLAISIGPVKIPIPNIIEVIISRNFLTQDNNELYRTVIVDIRLPRLLCSILVGAALSSGGVGLQTLFRNPLAEPYILGVSAGASLGVALSLVLGLGHQTFGSYIIPIMAFIGAALTTMFVFTLSRILKMKLMTVLLLGFAISFILSSLVTLLQFMAQSDIYLIFLSLLGSFSTVQWKHVQILAVAVPFGILLLFLKIKDLNVILMGDDYAKQSGVNVKALTEYLVVVTSLLTAVAVAVAGIIGLIGVVIPLIVRLMVGLDHKILLPCSVLLGALVLSLSDTLARIIIMPSELPVGVVTSLIGAPLFIYFLVKFGGTF